MADERKTYDLFAARLLNPDKGLGALIDNGITMENTSLEDIDTYRNKAKVQEIFKKEDGSFDEENFKKFYDGIQQEFVAMNAIGTENFVLNSYEKAPGNFSVQYGQFVDLTPKAEHVDNPLDLSKGLVGFNEWSEPTKSAREAAQQNRYWDNDEKKWSDKTVNEAGILGLLTGKSLVYATYDDDVKDQNGNIIHHKGEYKKDDFGNYYAETTNDEENLGKQFVTWSEVLTDDNSVWNKFDPFDSDDLNQNITRSLFKAAVIVGATMVNPEVGRTIFLSTAAVNLARNMPQIAKSINAFLGGKESKTLNKWDNFSRRFSDSQSDYSQEHFLSIENIINMATDSYMQLGQQRAIAMIPELFMDKAKMEKMANQAAMVATGYMSKPSAEMREIHAALTKAVGPYRELQKMQNHATKLSSAISRAYLVATSVQDVYNQSKIYGFDDQTAGVISLATYGAMGKLFQSDYFRGYLYNSADWEARRDIRLIAKNYLKNNASKLRGDVIASTDKATKLATLKKWGKNFSDWFTDHVLDPKMGRHSIAAGAMGEGLEEVSEEVAQDLSYQVGKAWQSVKELITGNEYTNNYSYKDTDPLARYSQSFFGGALGGAVFKLADRIAFDKAGYKHWKDLMNSTNNSDLMKELVYYVSQGKTGVINEVIDKLEKTPIASKTISYLDNTSATTDPNQSQNAVLFNSLRKAINDLDTFLDNNNLKIDYDRFGDIELIKGIRVGWLTSVADHGKGIHDDLFNTYVKLLGEIASERSEIDNINATLKDTAKEEEKSEAKANIKKHQDIINFKKQQIADLMDGKDDSYIGRMMMESQPQLMDALAENSKDSISNRDYGMNYDELPESYKKNVDEQIKNRNESGLSSFDYMAAWRTWKNLTKNDQLKARLKAFDEEMQSHKLVGGDADAERKFNLLRYLLVGYNQTLQQDERLTPMQLRNLIGKLSKVEMADLYEIGEIDQGIIDAFDANANWWTTFASEDAGFKQYAQKMIENLKTIDPEQLGQKISQSLTDQNVELTPEEQLYMDINGKAGIDSILPFMDEIYKEIKETGYDNIQLWDDIHTPMNYIKTDSFLKYIETLDKMVNGKDSNLAPQLAEIFEKLKTQGNKFQLTKDQINALNNLKKLFTLGSAILNGSNTEGEQLLEGAPFGANNFINKASKEKGWDYELSQVSKVGSVHGQTMAQQYNQLIDMILENDRNNKGMVPKLEKLLEAKLYRDINVRIANWLRDLQSDETGNVIYNLIKTYFEAQPEDKRIDIDKFKATLPAIVSESSSDEMIEAATVEARNNCLAFEAAFFNACLQAQNGDLELNYKEFVTKCLATIGDKDALLADTASLDTAAIKDGIDEPIFCTNASFAQYLLQCSYGQSGEALAAIKQQVNADPKYFPFGSQLNLVQHAVQFLTRGQDVRNNNQIWLQTLAELAEKTDYDQNPIIAYGLKMICSGGTGKTEVIIRLITNCLKTLTEGELKIFYAANTIRQLQNLKDGLGNDIDNLLISELISKDESFWEEHKDGYLIIDEASNLTLDQIKQLDELCHKYNINYLLAGDTNQVGETRNFALVNMAMTFRLNESKRVVDDINRDNLKEFEKVFERTSRGSIRLNPTNIKKLQYWDKPDNFSGIKFENRALTEEELINFLNNHNIPKDAKILILSDKISSLSNPVFAEYPNIELERKVTNIQGITWDYVINDLDMNIEISGLATDGAISISGEEEYNNIRAKLREIYTIISRPRHGFLSFKPIQFIDKSGKVILEFGEGKNVFESKFAPVSSGLLNDEEALNSTIEFEKRVLDQLNIPDNVKLKPAKSEEETNLQFQPTPGSLPVPPVVQPQPAPSGTITGPKVVDHLPGNAVQISAGFVPKNEFANGFGQENFGLTDKQNSQFRALVYAKLTNSIPDVDEKLEKLKAGLSKGKFYIKKKTYSANQIYDIASLGKSIKNEHVWLSKPQLYIIYELDGKEITLGMVKTPAIAKELSTDKEDITTDVLLAFEELNKKSKDGDKYDLDQFIKINGCSRSSNIIEWRKLYKGKFAYNYSVEFRNGQLYVVTNKNEKSNSYDDYTSSLSVYTISEGIFFNASQTETPTGQTVLTNQVVSNSRRLNQKYRDITRLAITGGWVDEKKVEAIWPKSEENKDIPKLFVDFWSWHKSKYKRNDSAADYYIDGRLTPFLQHKFVVFAKLNTDGTPLSFVDGVNGYNDFLVQKIAQADEILNILKSNQSADDKKQACENVIKNRILQTVTPICFDPVELNTNLQDRHNEIESIFNNILKGSIYKTLKDGREISASIKSYNYHLRNQMWTVLTAMELLYRETEKAASEGKEFKLYSAKREENAVMDNECNDYAKKLLEVYKEHREILKQKWIDLQTSGEKLEDDDSFYNWIRATVVKPSSLENQNVLASEEMQKFLTEYYDAVYSKLTGNSKNEQVVDNTFDRINDGLIKKSFGNAPYVPYLCRSLLLDSGEYIIPSSGTGASTYVNVFDPTLEQNGVRTNAFRRQTSMGMQLGIINLYADPTDIQNLKPVLNSNPEPRKGMSDEDFNRALEGLKILVNESIKGTNAKTIKSQLITEWNKLNREAQEKILNIFFNDKDITSWTNKLSEIGCSDLLTSLLIDVRKTVDSSKNESKMSDEDFNKVSEEFMEMIAVNAAANNDPEIAAILKHEWNSMPRETQESILQIFLEPFDANTFKQKCKELGCSDKFIDLMTRINLLATSEISPELVSNWQTIWSKYNNLCDQLGDAVKTIKEDLDNNLWSDTAYYNILSEFFNTNDINVLKQKLSKLGLAAYSVNNFVKLKQLELQLNVGLNPTGTPTGGAVTSSWANIQEYLNDNGNDELANKLESKLQNLDDQQKQDLLNAYNDSKDKSEFGEKVKNLGYSLQDQIWWKTLYKNAPSTETKVC